MGGRVYDPVVARFLSADSYIQAPYYSQDLNRYAYGWNSPLSVVDPTGYLEAPAADPPTDGIYVDFNVDDGRFGFYALSLTRGQGCTGQCIAWDTWWEQNAYAQASAAIRPYLGLIQSSADPGAALYSAGAVVATRSAARQPQVALGALAVGGIVAAYLSVSPTIQGAFRIPDLMSGKELVPPVAPLDMGGQAQDPYQADPDACSTDNDDDGPNTTFSDSTRRRSVRNTDVGLSRAEFEENLKNAGFSRFTSQDGVATNYVRGTMKYSVREPSKSRSTTITVDVYDNGELINTIRLIGRQ